MKLRSENLSLTEETKIKQLCALDWELINAHTLYYTHGYHPYSAKYIPQIPNRLISFFSKKHDLILDNFVGSGTTLVESKVLGRNAVGVDINPLACLISKVKTTAIKKPTMREISHFLISLRSEIIHQRRSTWLSNLEEKKPVLENSGGEKLHPNIPKWYHENVIYELLAIKTKINAVGNTEVRDFLLVAFSSLLRSVSNTTTGFGNLMINKNAPPKNRIFEKFSLAVASMLQSMADFNRVATNSKVTIIEHDSRKLEFINDESIDFICTHPPYMAAVPYAEYQKLSLWWLEFSQYDLERSLIGGRRSRPDTPQRFLRDMEMSLLEMKRVLRKKKYCCITIGNPIYGGKTWKLNEFIRQNAIHIGFTHLKEISRGKYHSTMGKMKEEFVLIFRKE
ncbi:MAG TPA: DNA methyltransferase [Candidatus Nitrosopolaris sp.]|nr:DNA methyltransferase [Candidatus Nitrosopolaris sp.]